MNERDRTVEEQIEHIAVPGDEFMPYGWGGRGCCEICAEMECADVCKGCSYTATGDFRSPVKWPCHIEKTRLDRLKREEYYTKYRSTGIVNG